MSILSPTVKIRTWRRAESEFNLGSSEHSFDNILIGSHFKGIFKKYLWKVCSEPQVVICTGIPSITMCKGYRSVSTLLETCHCPSSSVNKQDFVIFLTEAPAPNSNQCKTKSFSLLCYVSKPESFEGQASVRLAQEETHFRVYRAHQFSFQQQTSGGNQDPVNFATNSCPRYTTCPPPNRMVASVSDTPPDSAKGSKTMTRRTYLVPGREIFECGRDRARRLSQSCAPKKNIPFYFSFSCHWESKNALVIAIVCRIFCGSKPDDHPLLKSWLYQIYSAPSRISSFLCCYCKEFGQRKKNFFLAAAILLNYSILYHQQKCLLLM